MNITTTSVQVIRVNMAADVWTGSILIIVNVNLDILVNICVFFLEGAHFTIFSLKMFCHCKI